MRTDLSGYTVEAYEPRVGEFLELLLVCQRCERQAARRIYLSNFATVEALSKAAEKHEIDHHCAPHCWHEGSYDPDAPDWMCCRCEQHKTEVAS